MTNVTHPDYDRDLLYSAFRELIAGNIHTCISTLETKLNDGIRYEHY